MLKKSVWNQPNVLTSGDETVGADGGYGSTQHINVTKSFSLPKITESEELKSFNESFNADKEVIERSFGFYKKNFRYLTNRGGGKNNYYP